MKRLFVPFTEAFLADVPPLDADGLKLQVTGRCRACEPIVHGSFGLQ